MKVAIFMLALISLTTASSLTGTAKSYFDVKAKINESEIPDVDAGIKPDEPLYFLDVWMEELKLRIMEMLRAVRLISHEKIAEEKLKILAERKAEMEYLKERHKEQAYERLRNTFEEMKQKYEEFVKPKLSVEYTIGDGYATITLKNEWNKKIGYVTGGAELKNLDTGESYSYKTPIPFPLNLKPGEEKTFTFNLKDYSSGYWVIDVEVYTWYGYQLIDETYEVQI